MQNKSPWTSIRRAAIGAAPENDLFAKSLVAGLGRDDLDAESSAVAAALVEELHAATVAGKLPAVVSVPEGVAMPIESDGMTASAVGEGEALSATRASLGSVKLYGERIGAAIAVSEDLLRAGGAAADFVLRKMLSAAIVRAVDSAFLTKIATGATAIGSSGDLALDVRALLAATDADCLICGRGAARHFATATATDGTRLYPDVTPRGGTIFGLPLLVSGAPVPGVLLAVNSERVLELPGSIDIQFGRSATLEMEDLPSSCLFTGSPAVPVAAPQVSMFQTNSVAIRGVIYAAWSAQPGACAYVADGTWYSVESPASLV